MRAIAICGSPRRGGNTEQLLQHCLDRLAAGGVSGSLVRLAEKRVEHCTGCAVCKETADGSCAVAKVLGVSPSSGDELLHEKDFPALKIGSRIVVPKEKFITWVSQNTGGAD